MSTNAGTSAAGAAPAPPDASIPSTPAAMPPSPSAIAVRVPRARTARGPRSEPEMTARLNGANSAPVSSAERPSPPWSASTQSSSGGVVEAVSAAAARLAPARPSARRSDAGSSGSAARASMRAKRASRSAPAARPPAASGERDAVDLRPGEAEDDEGEAGRQRRGARDVEAPALAPGARLGHEQRREGDGGRADRDVHEEDPGPPGLLVITPPSSQPDAPPPAAAAVHTPSARRRSAPSGTAAVIAASAAGATAAAPRPWSAGRRRAGRATGSGRTRATRPRRARGRP